MARIGEKEREIEVQPLVEPTPHQEPVEAPAEPVKAPVEPEKVPA